MAAGPILITGFLLYLNARRDMETVRDEWTKYRCHPAYMPFVTMFTDSVTTAENFQYCTNAFAREIFARATDPVYQLFGMILGVIRTIVDDSNHFLTYLASMDTFILSFANDVFGKLFNTMSVFTQQIGALRDVMGRIGSSAYYAAFIAKTMVDFVMSVFNFMMTLVKTVIIMIFALGIILSLFYPVVLAFFLPLGAALGITFSCFHPRTPVETQAGVIPISAVRVGDRIGRSTVTGVFYFECGDGIPLYDYNGSIVAGEHLVQHRGKWMYVKDTGVPLYTGPRPSYIVCLNTSDNCIRIGSTLFRDYEETSDPDALNQIERIVWGKRVHSNGPPALHPHTLVRYDDDTLRPINTVKIGDTLAEGRVTGIVLLNGEDLDWYDLEGCVVAGDQPICRSSRMLASRVGTLASSKPQLGYQIFLDNATGWFTIHDRLLVRDYPDSHNPIVLDAIQTIVMRSLKK